jgi:hypothetical protein
MIDIAEVLPAHIGKTELKLNVLPQSVIITFNYHHTTLKTTLSLPRYVDEKLFLLGIALYAGEGTKAPQKKQVAASYRPAESQEVEFANDNPRIIKCFLDFLELLGFSRKRCVARLKTSSDTLKENISYWRKITEIPEEKFAKPTIRSNRYSTRLSEHGSLAIRVYCRPLWRILRYWSLNLQEFYKPVIKEE